MTRRVITRVRLPKKYFTRRVLHVSRNSGISQSYPPARHSTASFSPRLASLSAQCSAQSAERPERAVCFWGRNIENKKRRASENWEVRTANCTEPASQQRQLQTAVSLLVSQLSLSESAALPGGIFLSQILWILAFSEPSWLKIFLSGIFWKMAYFLAFFENGPKSAIL